MKPVRDDNEAVRGRIEALLAESDLAAASLLVGNLHPSDLADIVERLEYRYRVPFLSALPTEVAGETLAEMEHGEDRGDLLAALTTEKGAELLEDLADDDAVRRSAGGRDLGAGCFRCSVDGR